MGKRRKLTHLSERRERRRLMKLRTTEETQHSQVTQITNQPSTSIATEGAHSQANLISYQQSTSRAVEEKLGGPAMIPLKQVVKRVSAITGVSEEKVLRIQKELIENNELPIPKKKKYFFKLNFGEEIISPNDKLAQKRFKKSMTDEERAAHEEELKRRKRDRSRRGKHKLVEADSLRHGAKNITDQEKIDRASEKRDKTASLTPEENLSRMLKKRQLESQTRSMELKAIRAARAREKIAALSVEENQARLKRRREIERAHKEADKLMQQKRQQEISIGNDESSKSDTSQSYPRCSMTPAYLPHFGIDESSKSNTSQGVSDKIFVQSVIIKEEPCDDNFEIDTNQGPSEQMFVQSVVIKEEPSEEQLHTQEYIINRPEMTPAFIKEEYIEPDEEINNWTTSYDLERNEAPLENSSLSMHR